MLDWPSSAFQLVQGRAQAAVVDGEHVHATNTEAKWACTVVLENKVKTATMKIQNMKSIMQSMAEAVQAMQSMMMSNTSAGLVATGSIVREGQRRGVKGVLHRIRR